MVAPMVPNTPPLFLPRSCQESLKWNPLLILLLPMLSDLRMAIAGAERISEARGSGPVTGGRGRDEERVARGDMVAEEHERHRGQVDTRHGGGGSKTGKGGPAGPGIPPTARAAPCSEHPARHHMNSLINYLDIQTLSQLIVS
jgi:hypothetical protein